LVSFTAYYLPGSDARCRLSAVDEFDFRFDMLFSKRMGNQAQVQPADFKCIEAFCFGKKEQKIFIQKAGRIVNSGFGLPDNREAE
jgi:hypothetical protein